MKLFQSRSCRIALLAGLLGSLSQFASGDDLTPSAARMLEDVKILASDEYEGRGVGTEGLNKAADYIKEEFQKAGLKVDAVNGDAFQNFEMTDGSRLSSPNVLTLHGPDGKTIELKYDKEFRTCAFGSSGKFNAPIVFVGYGIDAPEAEYSDFANVDVKDKVVLLMRRNPLQSDPHGPFAVGHGISRHAALTTKISQAFTRGAAAVLLVNDPYTGRAEKEELAEQIKKAEQKIIDVAGKLVAPDADQKNTTNEMRQALDHLNQVKQILADYNADPLMEFGYGGTRSGKSLPCFQISIDACNEILRTSLGKSLADIEAQIDSAKKPVSQLVNGWSVEGEAALEVIRVPVKNVIGVLEGNGPLSGETIVIGAHYDHLGMGGEGSLSPSSKEVHNGADDNASGVAGLLELARRLAKLQPASPRRIVFIAFTAEERGLIGSDHYVTNPIFPLEKTVAMFNMDMIGRMEESKLIVFGTGTSSRWDSQIDSSAAELKLEISKKPEGVGPSDHSSFFRKDIPVLHLFTGTHSDYHRPGDDWQKINVQDMERSVDFLEKIIVNVATISARPDFIKIQGMATLERTGSRPYFGSIPDFAKEAEGYAIQGVTPESPAAKAGLKGGDVIIRIGKNRVGGLDDFDLALRNYKPGEQVDVTVARDGMELTLPVTLSTPRG